MKTSDLTGAALDWAVAKCEGGYDLQLRSTYGSKTAWQYTVLDEEEPERMDKFYLSDTSYSTDWNLGGPIIEREEIGFDCCEGPEETMWQANTLRRNKKGLHVTRGPTPLIAAMRCFVASKLGDEVDVPEELR